MRILLLIMALLSASLPLRAAPRPGADAVEIDLNDRVAVEMAMLDYPLVHLPWLRSQIKNLRPDRDPIPWARACWGLSIRDNSADADILEAILPQCVKVSLQHKLYLEWTDLRYSQLRLLKHSQEFRLYSQAMNELIQQIRGFKDPDSLAYILIMHAFELMELKIVDKSMPLIIEANDLVDSHQAQSIMVRYVTKTALDMSLDYQGLREKSIDVNEQMGRYFRELGIRFTTSRIQYNLGYSLMQKEPPEDDRAQTALLEAYRIAGSIDEAEMQGYALVSLSLLSSRRGQHKDAIHKAQDAIQIFTQQGSKFWLARSRFRLGEVLVNAGEFAQALPPLEASFKSLPLESRDYRNKIQWQQYKAYSGLKDQKNALRFLEQFVQGFQELARIEQKEEYNRAAATLGLQLEQERSASLQEHLRAEEQKNHFLKEQNAFQARELELAGRLRIAVIALLMLLAVTLVTMLIAMRRGRQVKRAKDKIQSIVDTIDEGILTIDANMSIRDEHSAYLQRLFPTENLAGSHIMDAILRKSTAPTEEHSIWQESLAACLGEDSIAWDLNGDKLPKEVILATHVLSLHWQPLFKSGRIHQLLLSIRDISSVKALEAEVHREKQRREGMQQHIMEILSHDFQDAKRLIQTMDHQLPDLRRAIDSAPQRIVWRRRLHTDKGVARSLGLDSLSRAIHALESQLIDGADPADTAFALQNLSKEIDIYTAIFEKILIAPSDSGVAPSLLSTLHMLLPDLGRRLQKSAIPLGGFEICDEIMFWDSSLLDDVRNILVHGLGNSIDHGFVIPARRGVQVAPAHFWVHARPTATGLALTIRDNGVGLDMEQLKALAAERGFVPGPKQDLTDVLWMDGVSLATQVTETSGRGVGLAAVKALCLSRQGHVSIKPNPDGRGTILELQINLPLAS